MSLIGWLLFLFVVVVINLLSCMIIEMVHSRTEEALHYLWTRASFMFASLETHITCIVPLTLLLPLPLLFSIVILVIILEKNIS